MAKRYIELPQNTFHTRTISEEDVAVDKEEILTAVNNGIIKNAEAVKDAVARLPLFSQEKPGGFPKPLDATERPEVVYHLDRISSELLSEGIEAPRALVLTQGKAAKTVFLNIAEAGIATVAPQTGDWRLDVNPKLALQTVPLGTKPSRALLHNAHAILKAAADAEVQAIFLGGASLPLGHDERFLKRAKNAGLRVFMPFETDSTRQHWIECVNRHAAYEMAKDRLEVADSTDADSCSSLAPWRTCHSCKLTFDNDEFVEHGYSCPECSTLARLTSNERIELILDDGIFEEWDADLLDSDPLDFPGYGDKIAAQRERTGLAEAVRTGKGRIGRVDVAAGFMDSAFFMGSMGSIVGEKIARLFDRATEEGLPVVLFCASGGARMQEGLASLMQMAKTSCAIERHDKAGLLYVSVITDPTTGGVTASFATLGDIILAEPGALIGFAGQRVIRDTIKQELPEGFQTAEFALEHGLIDAIVPREQLRKTLKTIIRLHDHDYSSRKLAEAHAAIPDAKEAAAIYIDSEDGTIGIEDATPELTQRDRRKLERHAKRELKKAGLMGNAAPGSAWESVQLARNVHRPTALTYIRDGADLFIELHGDRAFADDGAIVGGIGAIAGRPVTIIAQEKGATLTERIERNFGCPQPEGYRKSARLMRQAQKFGRPIVCLVDTQGAFCGTEAEERGQGNAIAENLQLMAGLTVPVVSILLGEGGSGGALALAVANRVAMQENAVYSVLSPEGFASILWKDGKRAPEAAEVMQMDSAHVKELGVVDDVLSEGTGAAHENPDQAVAIVRSFLIATLSELVDLSGEDLVRQRQERFARF